MKYLVQTAIALVLAVGMFIWGAILGGSTVPENAQAQLNGDIPKLLDQHGLLLEAIQIYLMKLQDKGVLPNPVELEKLKNKKKNDN